MAAPDVVDNALLALADDDSDSDAEDTKPTSRDSRTPSAEISASKRQPSSALKRPAAKKQTSSSKRRRDDESEDGEASSSGSMGSAAMSESESDRAPPSPVADGPLYPVDGKYTSETERTRVLNMTEIEREDFLAKRMEQVQETQRSLNLIKYMQDKVDIRKRKADPPQLGDTPRKRTIAKAKHVEALSGYKASRERKAEERRRGDGHRSRAERSSSDRDRYSDRDVDGESEVEWDEQPRAAPARDEPPATLHDYKHVRVGRSNFARVCYDPGFEEVVRGCFCRVAIGMNRQTGENQYRMTQVKGFTTGRDYGMEHAGRPFRCNIYAILAHGKAEKEWPFTACSDSNFTPAEFDRFRETLYQEGSRVPSKSYLDQKVSDINALLGRSWTEEEITERLRKRGWLNNQQAVQEKERIQVERQRAIAEGNESSIARLDQELAALEGPKLSTNGVSAKPRPPTQQERLAALNRANRKANAEEIRKAQIAERKRNAQLQSAIERGEAVPNPFARVKTKPKTHYDANEGEKAANKAMDELFGGKSGTVTPVNVVAVPAKPVKVKRVKDDDILAAMDLGIEIEI